MGLDLKDRRILWELDFSARKSSSAIAKNVGLSKQGVDYRINRLMSNGIIRGFFPLINAWKLGFSSGRAFFKLYNINEEREKEIQEDLLLHNEFTFIINTSGTYDLVAGAWVKHLTGFQKRMYDFASRHGHYIRVVRPSVGMKLTDFRLRLLLSRSSLDTIIMSDSDDYFEHDKIDVGILKQLSKDGRMPYTEISKRVKESPQVVKYRMKKMEDAGVIAGYRPLYSFSKLGLNKYKILFFFKERTESHVREFKNYLRQTPNTLFLMEELGVSDIDAEMAFSSASEFSEFMRNTRYRFPELVENAKTMRVVNTLRMGYNPFTEPTTFFK